MQLETFFGLLLLFLQLHSSQRCCLAMSSDDDIAHLLNPGAADSHAFNGSNSEYMYFTELDVDPSTDEEDASAEGKQ